tara:strand:+ start:29780 stop:30187 length:408 start_codon:yes stop_codon:yes gene_type:complete
MKKQSNIVIGILAALCVISIVALVIHFSNHDSQNVNVNNQNQNVNVNNRLTKLQDIADIHEGQLQQLTQGYSNLKKNVSEQQQKLQDIAKNTVPADGYLSEVDSIKSSIAILAKDISTLQNQKKEKYTYLRRGSW